MNNFKVGDLVYTDISGDVVKITNINYSRSIFSGEVVKYLDGTYPSAHLPIGFTSKTWWGPVFQKYGYNFKKIKII
jgi:hypothetical protein